MAKSKAEREALVVDATGQIAELDQHIQNRQAQLADLQKRKAVLVQGRSDNEQLIAEAV